MKVIYERSVGENENDKVRCKYVRFFKKEEEFNEWLERQLVVQPDIKIIEIVKES